MHQVQNSQYEVFTQKYIFLGLFYIFLAFIYAAFSTDFTLDFFQPYWLWNGYNQYFLSLIDGRLDIPAYAIGKEGQFVNGNSYMYYGLLPTLTRLFLFPFVDLNQVPASAFSVWIFSCVGLIALQHAITFKLCPWFTSDKSKPLWPYIVLTVSIWFGSGSFIILQNSSIYHEPYAASLCLINVFMALLIRDDFFIKSVNPSRLIGYAILAGLCVHARMPAALSLYSVTLALIFINTVHIYKSDLLHSSLIHKAYFIVKQTLHHYYKPLIIMFLFGISIFYLNYLKFGSPFKFMGLNGHYGFYLTGEFASNRICNVITQSQYADILRIIPNSIYYFLGAWNTHTELTMLLETGFGRKEPPSIILVAVWLTPIFLTGYFFILLATKKHKIPKTMLFLLVLFSLGGLYQLSYKTLAYRYVVALWPIFLFGTLFVLYHLYHYKRISVWLKFGLFGLTLATVCINFYEAFYNPYNYRENIDDGSFFHPTSEYQYSNEVNQFLAELDETKIQLIAKEAKKVKRETCKELKKSYKTNNQF